MSASRLALCSTAIVSLWPITINLATAQSITAAPDGTGTIITIDGQTYHIGGGTQAGANLFHSFENFGLSTGEIANFLTAPDVAHIFGRVVGGNASIIDGLIQANPNLYLTNPAGIVFGPNARLNVGGDFFATTADQICFEEGCFNSVGLNDYDSLVGNPVAFGFLQSQPGGIVNAGTLAVRKEKSLSLLGGTVVNLGELAGGNVRVAAVPGERMVRLSSPGSLLSLAVPDAVLAEGVNPLAMPELLTGAGIDLGTKVIEPGSVHLAGTVTGEQVDLYAADSVQREEGAAVAGDTRVVRFTPDGENPTAAVFIDERVDNPEDLLFGAEAGTVSQAIERNENGIEEISEQLAVASSQFESVAVVAEGNAGNFWLGNQWIRSANIADYQAQLQTWGAALTESADILLYSCFTALGATGKALVTSIAQMTGADVAASVDVTGSANYGGNWTLEHQVGNIEATQPFTDAALAAFEGKLAVLTVQSTADDLVTDGVLTFREALVAANNGTTVEGQIGTIGEDTIQFDTAGVFSSPQTITTSALGEFVISDDLIIEGTGRDQLAFDGNNANRVFNISANNVVIQDLTIQNGSAQNGSGGGILQTGSGYLSMTNLRISKNSSPLYGIGSGMGGGISVYGSTVVDNSIIENNYADNGGGILNHGDLEVRASTITNNQLLVFFTPYGGGGILNFGSLEVVSSNIVNNYTSDAGGLSNQGYAEIIDSTISGNETIGSSSGIYNAVDSYLYIDSTTITGNQPGPFGESITNDGYLIINRSDISDSSGGGIDNRQDGFLEVTSSTVSGNGVIGIRNYGVAEIKKTNISDNYGGGISNAYIIDIEETIISNTRDRIGIRLGGITNSSGGYMTIKKSSISNNTAEFSSGSGISNDGYLRIQDSTISGNSFESSGGGGIYNRDFLVIENSTISNNYSYIGSAGISNNQGYVFAKNVNFSQNLSADPYSNVHRSDIGSSYGVLEIEDAPDGLELSISIDHGAYITGSGDLLISGEIQTYGEDFVVRANGDLRTDITISSLGVDGGGNISLEAEGDINTRNLVTTGLNESGGNVRVISRNGSIDIGGGSEGAINTSSIDGHGGHVFLSAPGNINVGKIFTESFFNHGGGVNIESSQFVRVTGSFDNSDFRSGQLSISTAGQTGGGGIRIVHGGLGLVPFKIGDAALNGTAAALTTGANSPAQLLQTNQSFLFDHRGGGIRILTENPQNDIVQAVAGSQPIRSHIGDVFDDVITQIGDQLGANTILDIQSDTYTWQIPGEADISNAGTAALIPQLEAQFTAEYRDYLGDEIPEEDDEVSIASIREMLRKIQEQTGTVPVMVYASSYEDFLDLAVITPEEHLIRKIIPEATASELSRLTSYLANTVQDPTSDAYLRPAQKLYNWLIAPLQPELEGLGVDTLIFAMSAGLRTVPLAALHDGEQFLIEQYSLGMIPSLSLTNSDYRSLKDSPVVALGASEFQAADPLPAVPAELNIVTQSRPAGRQFLNAAFTLETLRRESQAQSYGIVHLATHAAFPAQTTNSVENAYIRFWNQDVGFSELRSLGWYNDPQVELLVLSACETALGDPNAELGFAGLAVQTGVKSALASLWKVSDLGTLALMSAFYEQLNDPEITIKAEALRQAQLALLRGEVTVSQAQLGNVSLPDALAPHVQADWSHPFFWSSFTLVGSPW